jgi:hypothetical protein
MWRKCICSGQKIGNGSWENLRNAQQWGLKDQVLCQIAKFDLFDPYEGKNYV